MTCKFLSYTPALLAGNTCIQLSARQRFKGFNRFGLRWNRCNNWLVVEPTPLKNDGVKVSWDDCSIPNIWRVIIHSCSSHHQPDKDPFVGPEIPIPWHLHLGHQRQPSHLCGGPRGRGARARAAQGRPGGLGIHEVRWNEMKLSKPAANPQKSKRQKTYNQVYLYYIII